MLLLVFEKKPYLADLCYNGFLKENLKCFPDYKINGKRFAKI